MGGRQDQRRSVPRRLLAAAAAVAGYPHVTVPAGLALGALPVGLSLFGRPEREWELLGMAYAFEQTIHGRRAPEYLPRLALP